MVIKECDFFFFKCPCVCGSTIDASVAHVLYGETDKYCMACMLKGKFCYGAA